MNRNYWKSGGLLLMISGCLLILSNGPAVAGDKTEWQLTTSMEMPGMPFPIPPAVTRQCLENHAVPYQKKSKGDECKVVSKKLVGSTMTWKVVCNGAQGKTEMNGVSTYSGSTMDSKVKISGDHGEFSMQTTGKKLGPCQ